MRGRGNHRCRPDCKAADIIIHIEVVCRISEVKGFTVTAKGKYGRPLSTPDTLRHQGIEVVFDLLRSRGIPGRVTDLPPVGAILADPYVHRIGRLERITGITCETAEENEMVQQYEGLIPGVRGAPSAEAVTRSRLAASRVRQTSLK